jgi:outer membrane receptor protein involved in Fe transport
MRSVSENTSPQRRLFGESAIVRGLGTTVLALLAFGLGAPGAHAQSTGRVVGQITQSSSGAPVSEAQIYIRGLDVGTFSRQDGRFILLNVPVGTHELRAERIGLGAVTQSITMTAGGSLEINFQMEAQALGLDEIVVTGTAGAARRREVGSSITQINVTELPDRPVNVSSMLQASAPGIELTGGGGGAGQGSLIRLRGTNSLNMGSDPIIYIDGVRMMSGAFPNQPAKDQSNRSANVTQSPLDLLNPNDIERIEVIKGSAATTLYGTEASAGVIQVFTKRGSQGAPVWTAEVQQGTGWSQRFGAGDISTQYDAVGTSKYMYMDPWICTGFLKCGDFANTAHTQSYAASVRGGGQNLQYFTSGELFDEQGNTPNDTMERWTVRGNFTFTPINDLRFQWNSGYTNQAQTNTAQGNNAQGLELNVFRQNQNYFADGNPELINRTLDQTLASNIERFTTGGTVTYSPLVDFTTRLTIGYDLSTQETRNIRPFGFFAHPEGIIHNSTYQNRVLTFDYVGTFSFDLAEGVRSNLSWGGQTLGDEMRRVEGYGRDFPGAAFPTVNSASNAQGYEERSRVWNAGFFFQNIFDISNKYFVTAGVRFDGNSAFGKNFGLQMYPKASLSWIISDEDFWQPTWGQVKLRTAYGQSGRAPRAFDAVRTWQNVGFLGQASFAPQNVGNPDLGPEVTGEFEFGADASWMSDRIRSGFTYYRQLTKDALLNVQPIPSEGFTANRLTNVGEIENKGMELSLDLSLIQRANFGWDVGGSFSTNSSEVLSWTTPDAVQIGRSVLYSTHTIVRNGHVVPPSVTTLALCSAVLTSLGLDPLDISQLPSDRACRETGVYRGSNLPTRFINGNTTVRLPRGISVSTRGEFRGGHFTTGLNPIPIGRSVRSPVCEPYYANQDNVALKPDTPALWVARCVPGLATGYSQKADYFKLRSISMSVPMDFAFPDRVQNATLTIVMGNVYTWAGESMFGTWGYENFSNAGLGGTTQQTGIDNNERIPAPTTLRASLRITF